MSFIVPKAEEMKIATSLIFFKVVREKKNI